MKQLAKWDIYPTKSSWFRLQTIFETHSLNSIATIKFKSPTFSMILDWKQWPLNYSISTLIPSLTIFQPSNKLFRKKQLNQSLFFLKPCRGYSEFGRKSKFLIMAPNFLILPCVHCAPGTLIFFLHTGPTLLPCDHHTHCFLYYRKWYLFYYSSNQLTLGFFLGFICNVSSSNRSSLTRSLSRLLSQSPQAYIWLTLFLVSLFKISS